MTKMTENEQLRRFLADIIQNKAEAVKIKFDSMNAFAKHVDITQPALSNFFNDPERGISLNTLSKISRSLGFENSGYFLLAAAEHAEKKSI